LREWSSNLWQDGTVILKNSDEDHTHGTEKFVIYLYFFYF